MYVHFSILNNVPKFLESILKRIFRDKLEET
jgi:hypothetical protein